MVRPTNLELLEYRVAQVETELAGLADDVSYEKLDGRYLSREEQRNREQSSDRTMTRYLAIITVLLSVALTIEPIILH